MINNRLRIFLLSGVMAVAACGGGGSSSSPPASAPPPPAPAAAENSVALVVDGGPAELNRAGVAVVNTAFASVTLCTPGTGSCQTIDHVTVDTGSVGLRLVASALSGAVAPKPVTDPASGSPLRECVQFADGYTWGSVVTADVQIGNRKLSSLPLNLIGDAAAGSAPPSCVSGPPENTVASFGSNGVLGIGNFLQDCGANCVSNAIPAGYYVCPTGGTGTGCAPTRVALDHQVPNPVAVMGSDNNGVTIQLAAVSRPGAATATGTLFFGVGTQGNNSLGGAGLFTLDGAGTFVTNFEGASDIGFVDSGSNAYFFPSKTLPTCADAPDFYCPKSGANPTSVPEIATIVGRNGLSATVGFTVDNADQVFATNSSALPGLAGTTATLSGGLAGTFDWGLPFFYGRNVYVLFEGRTLGSTAGPAVGF